MLATYKRDRNLPPLLKHLTTSPPPSLRQIVIVWQNVGVDLPEFLSPEALAAYASTGVTVTVRKSRKNSMNERFRPLADWDEPVKTRAVMIMDDDVVLQRAALEWGYQEFVTANEKGAGRLVGFTGRDFQETGGEWAYTVRPTETYSMVLSNAAWLRREWLEKYWEDSAEMVSLRNYVDKGTSFLSPASDKSLTFSVPGTGFSLQLRRHLDQLRRLEPDVQPSPSSATEDASTNHRRRRHVCARLGPRRRSS